MVKVLEVLNPITITKLYERYKTGLFSKLMLLNNPNVSSEDKQKIKELLKKPWNPYIRRHSALTEKSGILKEHHLRQYAGWSPSSQMHLKYISGLCAAASILYGNEIKDLQWIGRDSQGDYYVRSLDAKPPDMECFQIILSLDDPMRLRLKQQMILRKDLFVKALATKNVTILPRLVGKDKTIKCKHCQFKTRCWDEDGENVEAMKLAIENRPSKLLSEIGMPVVVTNHIND